MTTAPETWTRYPRSTDPEKDVAALMARLQTMKHLLLMAAYCGGEMDRYKIEYDLRTKALALINMLDREQSGWIAQRGVEAVRKAVMPEDK
jgi:hypothetical protein